MIWNLPNNKERKVMELYIYEKRDQKVYDIGNNAIEWVIQNLDYFDLQHEISNSFRWRLKTYVELVFLSNYLLRTSIWKNDKRLEVISNFIKGVWENSNFTEMIYYDPDGLAGLAIIGEFSKEMNYQNHTLSFILEKYREFGYIELLQKIPFRKMDLKYSLERAGIENDLPSYESLYYQTVAGKRASIPYMSTMDIYSVTHTLFYLTDMGNRPIERILSMEEKTYLQRLVLQLLGLSLRQQNLDTAGELLMCCTFLNISKKTESNKLLFQTAWDLLQHKQMRSGSIPSPTYRDNDKENIASRKEYIFKHCYHSTLVTIGTVTSWLS